METENNIHSEDMASQLFHLACKEGKLDVAQWIFSMGIIDFNADEYTAYLLACDEGHLNIAKWLYEIYADHENVETPDGLAFKYACKNGHLSIAKWLYSLGTLMIHADSDLAFRWACMNGQLETAKWLYSLGDVDVSAYCNEAFRWAELLGYYDIVDWLRLQWNSPAVQKNIFRKQCNSALFFLFVFMGALSFFCIVRKL